MLKTLSTWFRSRVSHEDLVSRRADVATERWDDVPFAVPRSPAQPGPQAERRSTPPPLPPVKTRPHLTPVRGEPPSMLAPAGISPAGATEWQEELLALARSTVSPVDPADVPTPPPLTTAPLPASDLPTPPPTTAPEQAAPQAAPNDDGDWDAVIARAKSGPIKGA
jgi:hypothetical protein